ncbi:MAG: hypothetical protein UW04_C0025G0005 [Parcubacteria group bacterium GW2011_GWB1_43_8]|nr:MAG: hypothetical protein UW04_C0025G0005 [Parcubacteria group bacterium GW2011_GWB1_43_8]
MPQQNKRRILFAEIKIKFGYNECYDTAMAFIFVRENIREA